MSLIQGYKIFRAEIFNVPFSAQDGRLIHEGQLAAIFIKSKQVLTQGIANEQVNRLLNNVPMSPSSFLPFNTPVPCWHGLVGFNRTQQTVLSRVCVNPDMVFMVECSC